MESPFEQKKVDTFISVDSQKVIDPKDIFNDFLVKKRIFKNKEALSTMTPDFRHNY